MDSAAEAHAFALIIVELPHPRDTTQRNAAQHNATQWVFYGDDKSYVFVYVDADPDATGLLL